MSDLISRQAAIDVIDAVFPVDPMKSEYSQGIACGAALAKTYVEQLPSAQPEIIHCAECKYQDKGSNESNSWNLCGYRPWIYVPTSDEHYCGDAERNLEEIPNDMGGEQDGRDS